MQQLELAILPFALADHCHACGNRTDGLQICGWKHSNDHTHLCPVCVAEQDFCKGCGLHRDGFGDGQPLEQDSGYCEMCRDIIGSLEG